MKETETLKDNFFHLVVFSLISLSLNEKEKNKFCLSHSVSLAILALSLFLS